MQVVFHCMSHVVEERYPHKRGIACLSKQHLTFSRYNYYLNTESYDCPDRLAGDPHLQPRLGPVRLSRWACVRDGGRKGPS